MIKLLTAVFALATAATAFAQAASAPQIRQHGGVAYVSAGTALRAEAIRLGRDMNLQLMFGRVPSGEPVSDVALTITDSHGQTVLDLASADPLLLARLVPGSYSVTATLHGRTLRRTVEVPARGRRSEAFNWSGSTSMKLLERTTNDGATRRPTTAVP